MESVEDAIARGTRAKQILDDPLVVEAFEVLERECIAQWRGALAHDTEGREKIWAMLKLTEKLRAHFENLIASGKLADAEVARIERERKLFGWR